MSNSNYDYLFKYIIIGDSSVGKSCVLLRFTEGRFKTDHQPTLGVQFGSRNVQVQEMIIKTQIWDTVLVWVKQAGQESFKAITRSYYKGSIAAFLIFDITNHQTFQSLNKWLYEVKNHSHEKVEIILVGNKIDLKAKRQVSFQEAQTFARNNDFQYFEVSASNGERVDELFTRITQKILRKIQNKELNPDSETSYGIRKGRRQKKEIISQQDHQLKKFSPEIQKPKSNCCK